MQYKNYIKNKGNGSSNRATYFSIKNKYQSGGSSTAHYYPFDYYNQKEVKNAQRIMNKVYGEKLDEDGQFGPKTQAAYEKYFKDKNHIDYLKSMQEKMNKDYNAGLAVDGAWGPQSEKWLKMMIYNNQNPKNNQDKSWYDVGKSYYDSAKNAVTNYFTSPTNTPTSTQSPNVPKQQNVQQITTKNKPTDTFPTYGDNQSTKVLRDWHNIGNPNATSRDSTQYVATIDYYNKLPRKVQFRNNYDNPHSLGYYDEYNKTVHPSNSSKLDYRKNYRKSVNAENPFVEESGHVEDDKLHTSAGYDKERFSNINQQIKDIELLLNQSSVQQNQNYYNQLLQKRQELYNLNYKNPQSYEYVHIKDDERYKELERIRTEIERKKIKGEKWYNSGGKIRFSKYQKGGELITLNTPEKINKYNKEQAVKNNTYIPSPVLPNDNYKIKTNTPNVRSNYTASSDNTKVNKPIIKSAEQLEKEKIAQQGEQQGTINQGQKPNVYNTHFNTPSNVKGVGLVPFASNLITASDIIGLGAIAKQGIKKSLPYAMGKKTSQAILPSQLTPKKTIIPQSPNNSNTFLQNSRTPINNTPLKPAKITDNGTSPNQIEIGGSKNQFVDNAPPLYNSKNNNIPDNKKLNQNERYRPNYNNSPVHQVNSDKPKTPLSNIYNPNHQGETGILDVYDRFHSKENLENIYFLNENDPYTEKILRTFDQPENAPIVHKRPNSLYNPHKGELRSFSEPDELSQGERSKVIIERPENEVNYEKYSAWLDKYIDNLKDKKQSGGNISPAFTVKAKRKFNPYEVKPTLPKNYNPSQTYIKQDYDYKKPNYIYEPSKTVKNIKADLATYQLANPNNIYLNAVSAGGDIATSISYYMHNNKAKAKEDLAQAAINFIPYFKGVEGLKAGTSYVPKQIKKLNRYIGATKTGSDIKTITEAVYEYGGRIGDESFNVGNLNKGNISGDTLRTNLSKNKKIRISKRQPKWSANVNNFDLNKYQ